jgi:hypothetical protein
MRGSLALWYECREKQTTKLPVELHFNLWRDLAVSGTNFFDVGILFKNLNGQRSTETTNEAGLESAAGRFETDLAPLGSISNELKRLFMFIPGELNASQLIDLSPLMVHGKTLNAVFNDVVKITRFRERSFETRIEGQPHLTFHNVDITQDVNFQAIEMERDRLGTLITFNSRLCRRFDSSGDHYIRIRFKLDERTHDLFSSEQSPSDGFLTSTINQTELTEFRLNERRSFPEAIGERVSSEESEYFDIRTINYFLMRDRRFELVEAHTHFRKMRLLEDDLWRHYLRGTPPGSRSPGRLEKAAKSAEHRIIIYQWRVDAKPTIKNFIAFANFRSPVTNLLLYAIVIVILGAAGAAVDAILADVYKNLIGPLIGHANPEHFGSHVASALFLTFLFLLILFGWRSVMRLGRWIARRGRINDQQNLKML